MKKVNLTIVVLLIANFGISQTPTTLFTETFESGNKFTLNTSDLSASTTDNIWQMNNTYTGGSISITCVGMTQTVPVANTPAQPTGITSGPSSNYMHIAAQLAITAGINCSSYAPAVSLCGIIGGSNFSKMTTSISTTGYSGIKFNFWWVCAASNDAFGEVYYSLDNGSNWVSKQTSFNSTSTWTQASLSDTAWDNQSSILFAFRFVNNTTTSTSAAVPAFSIDDITVTADTTLGIANNKSLISSLVYPNPTHEEVSIILNKPYKAITIHISDVTGKTIDVKHFKNTKDLNFKLRGARGLYFLNIEADAENLNYKMVKK
jgi:hypothetical protein